MAMRCATIIFLIACFMADADADAAATRIILAGDSTQAARSGYGDALCGRFAPSVVCVNMAKGGRSSKSYRAEGSWGQVLAVLQANRSDTTYVLMQFGHNDQPGKGERSTTLPEFAANLSRYVQEIRAVGATPVLITPLTRRQFKEGKLIRSLEEWAQATRNVAMKTRSPLLDLHRDSVAAIETMGALEATTLAQAPPPDAVIAAAKTGTTIEAPKPAHADPDNPEFDYTHLGAKGAEYFATIVVKELREAVPQLATQLQR